MYAVIEKNGKQYKVSEGDIIAVDLLDAAKDDQIAIEDVLLWADGDEVKIGTPIVSGVNVTATVLDEVKGDKVIAFKLKRRKKYRRKVGHRQRYMMLKIDKIKSS